VNLAFHDAEFASVGRSPVGARHRYFARSEFDRTSDAPVTFGFSASRFRRRRFSRLV
jgi:hypothetical protein